MRASEVLHTGLVRVSSGRAVLLTTLALLLLLVPAASAQIPPPWPVIAGTGEEITDDASRGDGGPAIEGRFNRVDGLDWSLGGNILVADGDDARIRKITPLGNIFTNRSEGLADPIAVVGTGVQPSDPFERHDFVVADVGDDAVEKWQLLNDHATWQESVIMEDVDASDVEAAGNGYWVADPGGETVWHVTFIPFPTLSWVQSPALEGLNEPEGIGDLPPPGNGFLVATNGDCQIRRHTENGTVVLAGTGFCAGREQTGHGDGGPATASHLRFPTDVEAMPDGSFVFTERERVRRVAPDGTISTVFYTGFPGSIPPPDFPFPEPTALESTPDGDVLVGVNRQVLRFDTNYAAARSDFNGDGYSDLAIGVPDEDFSTAVDGGLVHVVYGSASGLDASTAQAWSATSAGVVGTTNASDRFGAAVTTGDFSGDGFDDLAVGAPGDAAGAVANAGSVTILRGSAAGITGTGSVQITQNSGSVPDTAEAADGFGSALAAANLGGTGVDDLAIGVPGENSGAGAVNVLSGSATGLSTTSGALVFFQADAAGATETGDGFGSSLAAGNLGKTATADLAIGAPGEDTGSGAVSVLYSTAAGLAATDAQTIMQSTASVPGDDVAGDQLGYAVAIGDVTGTSTIGDLAAGMPGKDVSAQNDAGQVLILPGSAAGVTAAGSHVRDQDTTGVLDTAEVGDRFGASLVAANLAGAVKEDLAIGVPGESVGAVAGAGQIAILLGTTTGVTATNNQIWGQDHAGISDTAETGDHFGASLAIGQWGNTSRLDLTVGVPDETVGAVAGAGALNVIYGGATGLTTTGQKLLHQNAAGMPDNTETGDGLSRALGQGG